MALVGSTEILKQIAWRWAFTSDLTIPTTIAGQSLPNLSAPQISELSFSPRSEPYGGFIGCVNGSLSGGLAGSDRLMKSMHDIEDVILRADSDYVVKCMSMWINKWRSNEWSNSKGLDVANKDLIMRLDKATTDLENIGCHTMFFHVPRGYNSFADTLANQALERVAHTKPRQS